LNIFKNSPPETVEQYLSSRDAESLGIPKKRADYILQINEASTTTGILI